MRASGRFRVTKICERLNIHISSIPESGKGRGESDGETPNPVSCSLIPRYLSFGSCLTIQGKGFGNQGAVRLPVGGEGEACRFASAGTAGAVFLLLLEFIYTHHTRAAAGLRN